MEKYKKTESNIAQLKVIAKKLRCTQMQLSKHIKLKIKYINDGNILKRK